MDRAQLLKKMLQQPQLFVSTSAPREKYRTIKTSLGAQKQRPRLPNPTSIIKEAAPYHCGARICSLCLAENLQIIKAKPEGMLNKRCELISKCRHKNKFLLKNVD